MLNTQKHIRRELNAIIYGSAIYADSCLRQKGITGKVYPVRVEGRAIFFRRLSTGATIRANLCSKSDFEKIWKSPGRKARFLEDVKEFNEFHGRRARML